MYILKSILLAGIGLIALTPAIASADCGIWGAPFGNSMMGGWGFGGGWIFSLIFWALIIILAVFLIRWLIGGSRGGNKESSAVEILKQRYAKGEINKQEFEEKIKDLIK